jgi:hypothetical protein
MWQENSALHEKYQNQQQTINNILGFLASVFSKKKNLSQAKKRKLLIEDMDDSDDDNIVKELGELINSPQGSTCVTPMHDNSIPNSFDFNNVIQNSSSSPAFNNGIQSSSSSPALFNNNHSLFSPNGGHIDGSTEEATKNKGSLPILGEDLTLPIHEDMEILNDRLDSLSHLLSKPAQQWSQEDLDNFNPSVLQNTKEGNDLLKQMNEHGLTSTNVDSSLTQPDSEVCEADFDLFFNDTTS